MTTTTTTKLALAIFLSLLAYAAAAAGKQSSQSRQAQQCRLQQITRSQPSQRIESEGGSGLFGLTFPGCPETNSPREAEIVSRRVRTSTRRCVGFAKETLSPSLLVQPIGATMMVMKSYSWLLILTVKLTSWTRTSG
ncbi:hypothetical protein REPUB_Repub12eG0102100 [Reevesia pubescens]